jgi:hypothetical protein
MEWSKGSKRMTSFTVDIASTLQLVRALLYEAVCLFSPRVCSPLHMFPLTVQSFTNLKMSFKTRPLSNEHRGHQSVGLISTLYVFN